VHHAGQPRAGRATPRAPVGGSGVPLFAPYSPDARGVVDDRIVVRQAEPHDPARRVLVATPGER